MSSVCAGGCVPPPTTRGTWPGSSPRTAPTREQPPHARGPEPRGDAGVLPASGALPLPRKRGRTDTDVGVGDGCSHVAGPQRSSVRTHAHRPLVVRPSVSPSVGGHVVGLNCLAVVSSTV